MYTGIVQALGKIGFVSHLESSLRVQILSSTFDFTGIVLGESISVNGVCLTVVETSDQSFSADISPETLRLTGFQGIATGQEVNLEKSLKLSDRLGGHFVQGHVDGLGEILEIQVMGDAYRVRIGNPQALSRYIAQKGSICVDGVSLTVNQVGVNFFEVMIIPHTWTHTVFHGYQVGTRVNLEVDMIARHLERLLPASLSSL